MFTLQIHRNGRNGLLYKNMPRVRQVSKLTITILLTIRFYLHFCRPPPVDMGSPSPRLLPKCKSQCVGGDKNQLESDGDAPYFQFPPNEKEFDNICATSETPTSSSK